MAPTLPILSLLTLGLILRPLQLCEAQPLIAPELSPGFPPLPSAPPPTSGADIFPSPSHSHGSWGWKSAAPTAAPETSPLIPGEATPAAASPSGSPGGGDGIPFISSNPAVPLPTGETDTATIQPLPTPGGSTQVVVGLSSPVPAQVAVWWAAAMMVAVSGLLGFWI